MDSSYVTPLSLTIISSIFIGLAGLVSLWIAVDIIVRRGWETMMGIMIPVYILNALYLAPITLWTYLKYGRPEKPGAKPNREKTEEQDAMHNLGHMHHGNIESGAMPHHMNHEQSMTDHHNVMAEHHHTQGQGHSNMSRDVPISHSSGHDHAQMSHGGNHDMSKHAGVHMTHMQMMGIEGRPMFATVTVAVCHCGAGCLLGDIVGEWLVYGTRATLSNRDIWPCWLIDYAFALAFGIIFQYFSIAPMSGDWGMKTVWRAAKADFLSLTFFEAGLFGWMAAFEIGIFNWKLEMNTVTYWWMMQIGMFLGHWTAFPINWWLITSGIKEPCA